MRDADFVAEEELLRQVESLKSDLPRAYDERAFRHALKVLRRRNRVPLLWIAIWGWLVLVGLIVANYLIFRAFGVNYFAWYIDNGAVIAIALAFISALVDLDREPDHIAAHPWSYLSSWVLMLMKISLTWSPVFARPTVESTRYRSVFLDWLFSHIAFGLYALALAGYLLVAAPLQYWLNLVTGAPARAAIGAPIKITDHRTYEGDREIRTLIEMPRNKPLPADFAEIGFGSKPVTATAAVSAGVLWLLSQLF
jgi:hypothetical protein